MFSTAMLFLSLVQVVLKEVRIFRIFRIYLPKNCGTPIPKFEDKAAAYYNY